MYAFVYIFFNAKNILWCLGMHIGILKTIKIAFKFIFKKTRYQLFIGEESDSDGEGLNMRQVYDKQ